MQEIAIPDATFLDGDANTYPGEKRKALSKGIYLTFFYQLFNVALIAILAMWQLRHQLSPV